MKTCDAFHAYATSAYGGLFPCQVLYFDTRKARLARSGRCGLAQYTFRRYPRANAVLQHAGQEFLAGGIFFLLRLPGLPPISALIAILARKLDFAAGDRPLPLLDFRAPLRIFKPGARGKMRAHPCRAGRRARWAHTMISPRVS